MKKILLTGGGGYIGSYLLTKYFSNKEEYNVVCLDHGKSYDKLEKLVGENVELVRGDILDYGLVAKLISDTNIVIHLAGNRGEAKTLENLEQSKKTSVDGARNLVLQVKKNNVDKFIFSSSYIAYSTFLKRDMPLKETDKLFPDDNYGTLKAEAEREIIGSRVPYIIIRVSNIYGTGSGTREGAQSVVDKFIGSAYYDGEINVFGDGKQGIDFLHIDDLCEAILKIIEYSETEKIYNIGSGEIERVIDIAEAVKKSFGEFGIGNVKINCIPAPKNKIWPNKWMSIEKIFQEFRWKPETSLYEGVKKTTENFLKDRRGI